MILFRMVQKEKARRGRPRAYDPDEALASVLDVFWRAGYAATSIDEISAATGMNRPSIYAAFGDKHALYKSAIERYRAMSREQMRGALDYERPLREALRHVYEKALDIYYGGGASPLGCFMLGTALTEAVGDCEVRGLLAEGLRAFDGAFERRIRHAIDEGDLKTRRDPAELARLASATLYFIAIRSRAGEPREAMKAMADSAVDIICAA